MTIKKTFALMFAAMGVLLISLVVSIYFLNEAGKSLDESSTQRYNSFLLANELRNSSDNLTKMVRSYASSQNSNYEQIYNDIVEIRSGKKARPENYQSVYWEFIIAGEVAPSNVGETIALTELMKREGFTEEEMALLKESEARSNGLIETERIAMNAVKGNISDADKAKMLPGESLQQFAVRIVNDMRYEKEKARIMEPINLFLHKMDQRTSATIQSNMNLRRIQMLFICISTGLLIGCILFSYLYISRKVSGPLGVMVKGIGRDEQGQFRIKEIEVGVNNDIGHLSRAVNEVLRQMRSFVEDVDRGIANMAGASQELTATTDQSAATSVQISSSINDVAAGVTDQLTSVEKTRRVIDAVVSNVSILTESTGLVVDKSVNTAGRSQQGKAVIEQAIAQMENIEQSVEEAASVVQALGDRSKEIGQIVDTISGIAGQTNLLALNAAIEAARAGEQGKGFAVVAEEVRKLAEQSQEATKDISALIGKIQVDTDHAVITMNAGTQEVKLGANTVNDAGVIFKEIDRMIAEITEQVDKTKNHMEKIIEGNAQIAESVQEIADISKTTENRAQKVSAATEEQNSSMEQIAGASHSLAELGQKLQNAVNQFHI